jgi:hypothetical protein
LWAEVDRRAHDDRIVADGGEVRDEGPVDLDLIHRQALQVGQRGVSGAEVVDRQPLTHVVQTAQDGRGGLASISALSVSSSVSRPRAVPHSSVSSATVSGACSPHAGCGGDVDGHRQVDALVAPEALLAQRLVPAPISSPARSIGAFDLGHEASGASAAVYRVLPADQCLDAGDLPVARSILG